MCTFHATGVVSEEVEMNELANSRLVAIALSLPLPGFPAFLDYIHDSDEGRLLPHYVICGGVVDTE